MQPPSVPSVPSLEFKHQLRHEDWVKAKEEQQAAKLADLQQAALEHRRRMERSKMSQQRAENFGEALSLGLPGGPLLRHRLCWLSFRIPPAKVRVAEFPCGQQPWPLPLPMPQWTRGRRHGPAASWRSPGRP